MVETIYICRRCKKQYKGETTKEEAIKHEQQPIMEDSIEGVILIDTTNDLGQHLVFRKTNEISQETHEMLYFADRFTGSFFELGRMECAHYGDNVIEPSYIRKKIEKEELKELSERDFRGVSRKIRKAFSGLYSDIRFKRKIPSEKYQFFWASPPSNN